MNEIIRGENVPVTESNTGKKGTIYNVIPLHLVFFSEPLRENREIKRNMARRRLLFIWGFPLI
jgi:hypothetical protein